jgi:DNA-binding transcriptional LysR family regulator
LKTPARRGHPLAETRRSSKIDWEDYEWILPGEDSPARTAFQRTFYERTGKAPRCPIEANSFVTMLTLLSQTNLIGIAPRQIFRVTWLQREFISPDMGLKFPAQPTGVIWRAKSPLSAAVQFAIKELPCRSAGPR